MIVFKNTEKDIIRFSTREKVEDVTIRVEGLYSSSDDPALILHSAYFKSISPSVIYFTSHPAYLGYPFLKLVFEKDEKDLSEILIPRNNQWALYNYFSNSELKEINKGDIGPFKEIFIDEDYGKADQIPNLNTIVDLGFNCGWFALFSADKAQKYIAVEADDRLNSIGLTVNKKNRDKIQICNRVFHDTSDEDITFHLSHMNNSGTNSIWDKRFNDDEREPTPKKTINLPEIIKRYSIDYIDLLKVDIEGAEEFLLKKPNLEIVLNKVGALFLELHFEENIKAFEDNADIKSYFNKHVLLETGSTQMIKLTKKPTLNILKSIDLTKGKMDLLILSAMTKNLEYPANSSEGALNHGPPDWPDLTYKINKEYADIHGYDFKSVEAETKEGYWPTWIKIPLIKKHLEHYDYVFWIDADAVFCTEQPLDIFLGKNIGLTKSVPDTNYPKTFTTTSTGVILFKNNEFSFKVLDDLEEQAPKWADGAFLKENWHEQGFIDKLYIDPEIISTRDYGNDFYNLINRETTDLENVFETENFKIVPYRYQGNDYTHFHGTQTRGTKSMDPVAFIYHAGGDHTTKRKRLEEVYSNQVRF